MSTLFQPELRISRMSLEKEGFRVIRFTNDQVLGDVDAVVEALIYLLAQETKDDT